MQKRTLRMELVKQPAFWAAHMWNMTRGAIANGDPELFDAALGMSTDAIEAFYLRELSNELEWPYFHIPLRFGYMVEIEYANELEDHQIVYRVCQKEWTSPICVGKGGGHWQLPAFRWTELLEISRAVVENGEGRSQLSASTMLLLFPSVWLTCDDNVNEIQQQLIEAWNNLNLTPHAQIPLLVEQLIISIQSDIRWQRQGQLGWVNNGDNSTRNPDSSTSLTSQEFSDLLVFFNTVVGKRDEAE